jgi:hypothetical protein
MLHGSDSPGLAFNACLVEIGTAERGAGFTAAQPAVETAFDQRDYLRTSSIHRSWHDPVAT